MSDFIKEMNILLVDDDADLLQVLGERCLSLGLEVLQARNLLTAMTLVDKKIPDMLCIDVELPSGNGLNFCKMLVENPVTADVPIVVLTGKQDKETRQACRRLKVKYIPKSANMWGDLESQIRRQARLCKSNASSEIVKRRRTDKRAYVMPHISLGDAIHDQNTNGSGKTILIAEDDADLLQMLSQRLNSIGCSVIATNDALEAMNAINTILPDMVCLDVNMPTGNGLSVCEMMSHDARLRTIPVMILTGESSEQTIRRCHDLMAYYVEKNCDVWSRVEPVVREVLDIPRKLDLRTEESEEVFQDVKNDCNNQEQLIDTVFEMLEFDPEMLSVDSQEVTDEETTSTDSSIPWVLTIDDDVDYSDALKCRLESHGVAVVRAFDGTEGYRKAFTHQASAILLDYEMPNGQGDYVLGRLKDNPITSNIPVIVVTGVRNNIVERKMYNMGASGYLTKPVKFETIRKELAKHISILNAENDSVLLGQLSST